MGRARMGLSYSVGTASGTPRRYGDAITASSSRREEILARIRAIPEGFVRTYADIDPRAPRLVGQVLQGTDADVPWHRVVRSDGSLALGELQRRLLDDEGVPMRDGKVRLDVARLPV